MAKARAAGADRLHLLLVGDGMSRAGLETLVQELGAGDYVTFYGSVPAREVPRFTTLADALLISLSDTPDLGLTVPGQAGQLYGRRQAGGGQHGRRRCRRGAGRRLRHVSPACDADALADNLCSCAGMSPDRRAELGRSAQGLLSGKLPPQPALKKLEAILLPDGRDDPPRPQARLF